jgi:hypothetical protein
MVKVPIPPPRATISEASNGLEVSLPPRRRILVMIFMSIWLCGWVFGEVMVIRELIFARVPGGAGLFMLVWLAGWTVGGGVVTHTLLWSFFGSEHVMLRSDALVITRAHPWWTNSHEYAIESISNLRATPDDHWAWGTDGGKIAFDYGARTFRFAAGIDEAEARSIVSRMKERRSFGNPSDSDG